MTLIITRACSQFVLHVSDRLVTRGERPFDILANKSLLYHASNALVAIGYSGHAFIGSIPTDQWIAEKLIGKEFDRGRKVPAITSGPLSRWRDIGQSLRLLRDSLDHVAGNDLQARYRRDWMGKSFDVLIGGWQWDGKGRARPILAGLTKPRNSESFDLIWHSRHWYLPVASKGRRVRVVVAPAENISRGEHQALVDSLTGKSVDETQDALVNAIRKVSHRVPVVGADCMSILLFPPSVGQAHVNYVPVNPATANLSNKSSFIQLAVAFSPWIIGPTVVTAPSIMNGETQIGLGYYRVYLHAPPHPHIGIMFSQERPTI